MHQKPTYVLIGHGSPNSAGNKHLLQFAEKLRRYLGEKIYLGALENFTPAVPEILDRACRESRSKQILVMPLFLFAAYHCKKDIPRYLKAAQKKYRDVSIHYAPALGNHPLMLAILHEGIEAISTRSRERNPDQTLLVLIGRGTSDPEVTKQFKQIGKKVAARWRFKEIQFAFMAVKKPTIQEALERCRKTKAKRIIVIPYLLFYGVLVEKITKQFLNIQKERPDIEVYVTKVLGNHPNLMKALLERSKQTAQYE